MAKVILLSKPLYTKYRKNRPDALKCMSCSQELELFDVVVPTVTGYRGKIVRYRCLDCALKFGVLRVHRNNLLEVSPNVRYIVELLSRRLGMRELGRTLGRGNKQNPHNPRGAKNIIIGKTKWIKPKRLRLISRLAKENL